MTARIGYCDLTDQELVELALRHDEAASRELVDRYREKVFAIAVGILEDSVDAESAWQETFIRVFRSLARYQPDRAFGNWVARIARNAARDKARQYRHNMLRIDEPDADAGDPFEPLQIPDRYPNPLETVINHERLKRATFAMASLDPRHRQAILLDMEGLPHAEIAELMGAPVNTVRTWIFRGRARLQRICA